jgi:hypothetical protein
MYKYNSIILNSIANKHKVDHAIFDNRSLYMIEMEKKTFFCHQVHIKNQ